jgi:tetratricopeptide (TPR) repeat protein
MRDRAEIEKLDYWDRLVQSDPSRAFDSIMGAIDSGQLTNRQTALAWRAASRCLLDLGRIEDAGAAAKTALAGAENEDVEVLHAVVMSAAAVFAEADDVDSALSWLSHLADRIDGAELGRVRLQTAVILMSSGKMNEAMVLLVEADELLATTGEPMDQFRLLFNRGFAQLQQNRLNEADSDFAAAAEIATTLGMSAAVAQTHANRGVVAGRARRLRDALAHFTAAADLFAECGNPARSVGGMEIDRAEVLLLGGLALEAAEAAQRAVRSIALTGNRMLLGDANLVAARWELSAGRLRVADQSVNAAIELLKETNRTELLDHAAAVSARINFKRSAGPDDVTRSLLESEQLLARLRSDDAHSPATDLALARINAARSWGLLDHASPDIAYLREGTHTNRRDRRIVGCLAEAVEGLTLNDSDVVMEACERGLTHVDEIAAEAPTLSERSAALGIGASLSSVAIHLALTGRDAALLFAAAEGMRARALHDELELETRHRGLDRSTATGLLEKIQSGLGPDRTLVEWIADDAHVSALVIRSDETSIVRVGPLDPIVRARDRLLSWITTAVHEPGAPSPNAIRASSDLGDLLLRSLDLESSSEVIMIPSGELHAIPWSGLTAIAGLPVTLAPSGQLWLEAEQRSAIAGQGIGAVAGPSVEGQDREIQTLQRHYPQLRYAGGDDATAITVRAMLEECDVVHIAAHGRFRADRPLISTIELAEGEASFFDVVPPRNCARVVMLSSCEGGAQATSAGSEVLGPSSLLLARGTASVVAPLTVVGDLQCGDFGSDVHDAWVGGEPIATAVSMVRQDWLADPDLSRWAVATSFNCFGSGRSAAYPPV